MSWSGKRVLVTGAGGFIGSHLAERLVESGATVRALAHYHAFGTAGWLEESPRRKDMEIVLGDVCDRDCMGRVMAGVDVVFHLAALIGIPYSYRAPAAYVRANIEGTMQVLQVARESGSKVIHTSTSEVYGTARYTPIDESHPLQGQSPYSATKIGADKLAESFHLTFGLPVVTVRPFNTFGPRQSARAVIPTIIIQALSDAEAIVLGSTHPLRDLNYVDNTTSGFLAAAQCEEAVGKTINLGSGREISIGELAELITRLMRVDKPVRSEQERVRPEQSEVGRLLADTRLAHKVLGWKPAVSLEEGLARTIDWFSRSGHLSLYKSEHYNV